MSTSSIGGVGGVGLNFDGLIFEDYSQVPPQGVYEKRNEQLEGLFKRVELQQTQILQMEKSIQEVQSKLDGFVTKMEVLVKEIEVEIVKKRLSSNRKELSSEREIDEKTNAFFAKKRKEYNALEKEINEYKTTKKNLIDQRDAAKKMYEALLEKLEACMQEKWTFAATLQEELKQNELRMHKITEVVFKP